MYNENTMGRGWTRIPQNKTNTKMKITKSLIAMRKQDTDGVFRLDQNRVLTNLPDAWGSSSSIIAFHHNDQVRNYDVTMTMPENREIYQRLSEGCEAHKYYADPIFSSKQMFQAILSFNNADAVIESPGDAFDMDGINDIDPNDQSRIRIERDCE